MQVIFKSYITDHSFFAYETYKKPPNTYKKIWNLLFLFLQMFCCVTKNCLLPVHTYFPDNHSSLACFILALQSLYFYLIYGGPLISYVIGNPSFIFCSVDFKLKIEEHLLQMFQSVSMCFLHHLH